MAHVNINSSNSRERDIEWLGMPGQICGLEVGPLTIRILIRLTAAGSPFVVRRPTPPTAADVAIFLWALSPDYPFPDARKRFIRRCRRIPFEQSKREIVAFLEGMFRGALTPAGRVPMTSYAARYVHRIASSYGWDRAAVLDLPLPQLHQLLRQIEAETANG